MEDFISIHNTPPNKLISKWRYNDDITFERMLLLRDMLEEDECYEHCAAITDYLIELTENIQLTELI